MIPFVGGGSSPIRAKSWTPVQKLDWDFLEPRTLLVGSTEDVAEKVQELQETCNLEYLLVEFTHPGMPLGFDSQEPGKVRCRRDAQIRQRVG